MWEIYGLIIILIILVVFYCYNNGYVQFDFKTKKESNEEENEPIVKTSDLPVPEDNLSVQGKLPPSAEAMFGRKSPATCNFDNRAKFNSRMQPEDRTLDLRLAQRQKMCQQNQYRNQYNQARTNVDRFRFIWKDELDEQERRQWMNQPAGATRMTRYDDY